MVFSSHALISVYINIKMIMHGINNIDMDITDDQIVDNRFISRARNFKLSVHLHVQTNIQVELKKC